MFTHYRSPPGGYLPSSFKYQTQAQQKRATSSHLDFLVTLIFYRLLVKSFPEFLDGSSYLSKPSKGISQSLDGSFSNKTSRSFTYSVLHVQAFLHTSMQ